MGKRIDELVARLHKGARKTADILGSLTDDQWELVLYEGPPVWKVRDLAAHFVWSEEALLSVAKDIAAGGPGAPENFDYDEYNAQEQRCRAEVSPQELLADLAAIRQATIEWTEGLDESDLDRIGRHPGLGDISLEMFLTAFYGHQLLHMRELRPLLR
jgi:hypothetical protein